MKAEFPILVTDLPSMVAGMISAPDAFSLQPVMVTASPLISYFKLGLTGTASAGLVSAAGSSGLPSSLGAIGFSWVDSDSSGDDFSPQPPRRRGSDIDNRSARLILKTMPAASR